MRSNGNGLARQRSNPELPLHKRYQEKANREMVKDVGAAPEHALKSTVEQISG
jgi:hypothetical protein